MTTLSQFITEVKTGGIAKTNRYLITFEQPNIFTANNELKRKLAMFCSQTQLPGVNISTFQSRTFGETREIPYERLFDNVNFTFYVDKDMLIKTFFDSWINGIQDTRTRTFNYYKDYITDIEIRVYDKQDASIYSVKLFEAYPKTITPISLGYDQKDIMQIQVSMNYKYWEPSVYTNNKEEILDANGISTGLFFNNIQEFSAIDFSFPQVQIPQELSGIFGGFSSGGGGDFGGGGATDTW
jgi:hypothetical protein